MTDVDRLAYEKYCARMQFEHELINNRLTWLLVSQTLLFSSYAASLENGLSALRTALPVLGFALSLIALVSIAAALFAKRRLWLDVLEVPGHDTEPFWVSTGATRIAAAMELLVPVSFSVAWGWLWSH